MALKTYTVPKRFRLQICIINQCFVKIWCLFTMLPELSWLSIVALELVWNVLVEYASCHNQSDLVNLDRKKIINLRVTS